MAISKSMIKKNGYRLKGSLRKSGFDCWRYFFYARIFGEFLIFSYLAVERRYFL